MAAMIGRDGRSRKKSGPITVFVADDQPLVRQAIRASLEKETDLKLLGEAVQGEEAIKLVKRLRPDVVIVDVGMFTGKSPEVTQLIKTAYPRAKVVVLTTLGDDLSIMTNLGAGASGYLMKGVLTEELMRAIHAAADGEMIMSYSIGQRVMKYVARYPPRSTLLEQGEKLSRREMEILQLIAQGMRNRDIATQLELSLRTVKGYVVDIFSKLRVNSRTEAVIAGLRAGLISLDGLR